MSVRQQPPSSNPAPQFQPSHGSRRDNQSVSSSHSIRSTRSGNPAVESAVTRLLVAIKQLLESLTLWSTQKMSELQVSDVYVRLGNGFNEAVAAFAAFNIDMTELLSVPDDLRNVLEQCLAEEASPENLELYLPIVRQIITNLLQGLRGKQSIYRRIVSDSRRTESGHARDGSRSSRAGGSSRREGERGTMGHRSQLSRALAEHERPEGGNVSRRPMSSRRRDPPIQKVPSSADSDDTFASAPHSGRALSPPPRSERSPPSHRVATSPKRRVLSGGQDYFPDSRSDPSVDDTTQQQIKSANVLAEEEPVPPPTPAHPQVPANVTRYSLVDRPVSSSPPAVVVEEPSSALSNHDRNETGGSSSPDTPPLDALQVPAMVNSLAALKKSDTLERRASKRFSTYNISKMTGGSTTRERTIRGNHPNRRSLAATNAPLTPGDLAVLTEVEDEESPPTLRRHGSSGSRRSRSTTPLEEEDESTPPVPPLPPSAGSTPEPEADPSAEVNGSLLPPKAETKAALHRPPNIILDEPERSSESPTSFNVFLQLGREVKKVKMEPGMSFSSLRVLFVDKFSYNPGLESFPAIYIRDPSSGVQYELEDMDEVKEKCLLSLNIEPLDQIKQHIDTHISTLAQDIKELRKVVTNTRSSSHLPTIIGQPLSESTPAPNRPTDRQFQHVAHRLSRIVSEPGSPNDLLQAHTTGQSLQSQVTGGSVLSEYTGRVVGDLKTQFDEVQNLRRDLGIMRQLYSEFMKSTKESLGALRTQTQSVKQIAKTGIGGARGYIESGKTQLDIRTQNVLTKVEELQDTVEGVKDDVLKRNVTPKPGVLKSVKEDIGSVATELKSLKEHIQTVAPMWKKTWEEELQTLIEEQQFLAHQEEFLNDLLDDHKAVVEIHGHVEKVISLRGSGSGRKAGLRTYKPPPPDEGHNGLSTVMLEIRGAAVDPEKRLKAIAANQKNREKELASKSDEFQAELSGFVGGKKLKMTGGAEEIERVRQKRNDMALKAMFTGNSTLSFDPDDVSSPPLEE